MRISEQLRVDGLTDQDHKEIAIEAERRGMFLARFRGELLLKGLEAFRNDAAQKAE